MAKRRSVQGSTCYLGFKSFRARPNHLPSAGNLAVGHALGSFPPRRRVSFWQAARVGIPTDTDEFELISTLMQAMLRALGYAPSEPVAKELAGYTRFKQAEPPKS